MMYLGYDFSAVIPNKSKLPKDIQLSLSAVRMDRAKVFLAAAKDCIAKNLDLFTAPSKLKSDKVGISILENYTGKPGYPKSEEKQSWHSDYGAEGMT
jgi:hypothetical protein